MPKIAPIKRKDLINISANSDLTDHFPVEITIF